MEDGNFRLNTRFLKHSSVALPPTNQKGSQTLNPHPKYCLLFLGTRDDHPVRSPVWPLSISSLRGANSFKLNCYFYKGESWFQAKKYLELDLVERDFCSARQAYAHAQQEEVIEETDLRPIPKKYLEYEVSQGGVVRGSTVIETAHPGQAP